METTFYFSLLLTYYIFIFLGYNRSNKISKPNSVTKLILIVSVTIFVGWLRIGKVVDIYGFIIQFNWCLQGFGIGFVLGLIKNKFIKKLVLN